MLYVSVLLASFTIRFYPLSYLCYTYIHAYAHLYIIQPFCFTRFFSSFSLTFFFLFTLSSFSSDTLTIDYATSWQIYVVLATVSYSRTRRLSPIANYIRSLLHSGELRVPRGFSFPRGERGPTGGVQG